MRIFYYLPTKYFFFYNKTNSTVPQATYAAVTHLYQRHQKPIVLFLGGLSKGVDRKSFVQSLTPFVRGIITFGAEAPQLARWATEAGITAHHFPTLESAFHAYTNTLLQPSDVALFSPSGSSFDLFHDFQSRGNCFVQLVHDFANN
jgi:UDP-N-acetylmuramoylalanine--D-glutamate ligase